MFSQGKVPSMYCLARGRNSRCAKSRTVCTKRRCSSDRVTNTALPPTHMAMSSSLAATARKGSNLFFPRPNACIEMQPGRTYTLLGPTRTFHDLDLRVRRIEKHPGLEPEGD